MAGLEHGGDVGIGRLRILAPVLLASGPSSMNCMLHDVSRKSRGPHTYYGLLTLQVKMWVQLLIPRIEDGNNFGVSIQVMCFHCTVERKVGEILLSPALSIEVTLDLLSFFQEERVAELRTVESEAASYLDQISR